ncbi:MAG: class II glutamine amidotransferase [Actinomycetota bacterium]|nr:class II glutamine amidotransferase [Chloroflexota bacterium]MDA3022273.1 class II glutamine amidotransferase [Actinomycetota bacterium]
MLAWRSEEPLTPRAVLGADADRLDALSRVHCDGWGYARVTPNRTIAIGRGTEPAHRSSEFLTAMQDDAASAAVVHLRWATEDLAVNLGNTHPFSAPYYGDQVAFVHNGMIPESSLLLAHIDEDLTNSFRGDTDSERYFGLLMTELRREDGDVINAYRRTAKLLADFAYTSLNAMLITPKTLAVACLHKPENRHADFADDYFPLTWGVQDGVVSAWSMGVRPHAADKRPLDNGTLLTVDIASGAIDVVPLA